MNRSLTSILLTLFAATTTIVTIPLTSSAVIVSGTGWSMYYNEPNQNTSLEPAESDILNGLLDQINSMPNVGSTTASLATFTFSGNVTGAGAILNAINNKLLANPNATFTFIGGALINPFTSFSGLTLNGLSTTYGSRFQYYLDPTASTDMHHKVGLFDYGGGQTSVYTGSWNFTGGASLFQWNVMYRFDNNTTLYNAYKGELDSLAMGNFNTNKGPSGTFLLPGSSAINTIRFGPHANALVASNPLADNAGNDITDVIDNAQYSIVAALNKLSNTDIQNALVNAANRGVKIYIVMPLSDITGGGSSESTYNYLNDPANYDPGIYAANVHFLTADANGQLPGLQPDSGESNLIHTKWLVADANTPDAVIVTGSANFTETGLRYSDTSPIGNDENILIIRGQPAMANAHVNQFEKMTGQSPDALLNAIPVPEPSTYAMLVFGTLILTWALKRRTKHI